MSNEKIKQILIESGITDDGVFPKNRLDQLLEEAEKKNRNLYDLIIERDVLQDFYLGKILAEGLGFPYVTLSRTKILDEVLQIIPEIVAKKQKILAFELSPDGLKLAMADPENIEIREFVEKKVGVGVIPYFATERDINNASALYRKDVSKTLDDILQEVITLRAETGEGVIVKLVDELLLSGNRNKSSDIHIEPYEKDTLIRFRIDGVLHEIATLPKKLHDQIISRIKILSRLKTDEHLSAQDGKLQFLSEEGETVDVRVSIVPIIGGEKAVLRLLSAKARQFSLEDLGLGLEDMEKVRKGFSKPWGMVLATGPTGSGKTTSVYAVVKILNRPEVNIATIEDPVEYDIEGINQIQVNSKTNLTFAKGLGSILRQDPDIIFVGEIRDEETAGIAINAAMTGHLVLSTLHTNDAATTLPRLADMKIEPFLIASSVNVAIAQRLVRKICPSCINSAEIEVREGKIITPGGVLEVDPKVLYKYFPKGKTLRVYEGKTCPVCKHTGYVGRTGIFEVLEVTPGIRELIMAKANSEIITKKAVEEGMTTMFEDGLRKVAKGVTTIEEVMRAVKT
ncbi:MAG: Flp pilus assembly complex ATPase component TadA [Candidatus Harrisonbacteria bacterium]|nr:Flp pilus assembly complex ATPase component TadA [Candidatus Harrisonbacteria bacterium]